MKVILVGGGSGGHLTPLLAVGSSLKSIDKSIEVVHIGQKGEKLQDVIDHESIDRSHEILAGKFRRYHGETFLQHLIDFKTLLLNFRDFFKFLLGIYQAWRLLRIEKPDAIFLKGGFVCVPVGYAARVLKIPYITHDSDVVPGLANRLTAKQAVRNTVAMNPELYPYERSKTIQVGIPIQPEYKFVSEQEKHSAKVSLGFNKDTKLVLSVGGGLGARKLNQAVVNAVKELLDDEKFAILHLTGKALYQEVINDYKNALGEYDQQRVKLIDFSTELYNLSKAADVVITRAGATNIAEFAVQAKPCIVVPAPHLTGGQQLHNADLLLKEKAAIVIPESDLPSLAGVVKSMLNNSEMSNAYAKSINGLAFENSAQNIAEILIDIAKVKNF